MDPVRKNTVVYRVLEETMQSLPKPMDRPLTEIMYERLLAQGLLHDHPRDEVLSVMRDALAIDRNKAPRLIERVYDALAANQMLR